MKIFAIRDACIDRGRDLAWLFYYEKDRRFYIEISRKTDEWEAPLILSSFVRRGRYAVDSVWSREWVRQRIVPEERQNLGMVLKANGLEEYDEFRLLLAGNGRCAQDDCYLVPVKAEHLPEELEARMKAAVSDVFSSENTDLVFFKNGTIRVIERKKIEQELKEKYRLFAYENRIRAICASPGGHALVINEEKELTCEELHGLGETLPVRADALREYFVSSLVDTPQAAELLGCTRQNIQDLVKREKLKPAFASGAGFLFFKNEIEQKRE